MNKKSRLAIFTSGFVGLLAFFSLMVAVSAMLAGCSGGGNSMTKLIASPNPPVADVPVPIGFNIDLSHSQSTYVPGTNLRLVNQEYTGSDPRLSVARFYLSNMTASGWKTLQEVQNPQGIIISFSKAGEVCTVTIKHGWFHTHLFISITPIGNATTQPTS